MLRDVGSRLVSLDLQEWGGLSSSFLFTLAFDSVSFARVRRSDHRPTVDRSAGKHLYLKISRGN